MRSAQVESGSLTLEGHSVSSSTKFDAIVPMTLGDVMHMRPARQADIWSLATAERCMKRIKLSEPEQPGPPHVDVTESCLTLEEQFFIVEKTFITVKEPSLGMVNRSVSYSAPP